MEELIQLIREGSRNADPLALVSVVAGVAVFILELILYDKGIIFSAGEKRLKHAKKMGYTITAHRTFINFQDRTNSDGKEERVWEAVYEYDFKGHHGKKMLISHHGMPGPTLTLYHDGESSRVYLESEMRQHKRSIWMLIIPIVVVYLVAKFLGYQM